MQPSLAEGLEGHKDILPLSGTSHRVSFFIKRHDQTRQRASNAKLSDAARQRLAGMVKKRKRTPKSVLKLPNLSGSISPSIPCLLGDDDQALARSTFGV